MDLRNLKVDEIKNLHEYHNVFGNFNLIEQNNLLVNEDTAIPNQEIERCNRLQIKNYLKLIKKLFDSEEYITFEVSAQLQIFDMMLESITPVLSVLSKELAENEYVPSGRSDVDSEAWKDYSAALQRYGLVADIKQDIDGLYPKLSNKLDELMDMIPIKRR